MDSGREVGRPPGPPPGDARFRVAFFAASIALTCAVGVAGAAPAAHRPPPKRIYVVVLEAKGVSEVDRRQLEDAVARGVRGDGKIEVLSPDRAVGAEDPEVTLAKGDQALAKARENVQNFKLGAAIELLEQAAEVYRDNLPDLALRDGNADRLFDVYRELAVAQFLNGDEDAAGRALAHCLVFKPKMDFTPKLFPPQMEEFVISAGLLAEEMGRGSLEVTVRGGASVVYVNGIERGDAPLRVEDLPAGPNVVNAVGVGTPTATAEAEIEGGGEARVELEVLPPPVAIPKNVAEVSGDVGRSKVSDRMAALRKRLGVEALVVVVSKPGGEGTALEGYVYDLRSGRLAGKATSSDGVELGGALMATADWGQLPVVSEGAPHIWNPKHKYFWHAVGVAAGVATVVTVGVIAARSRGLSDAERVVVFGLGTRF